MTEELIQRAEKLYADSLAVLKANQLPNGGCLASEPGQRYPYVYPRDHAYIIKAFLSAGLYENARKAIEFIFNAQLPSGAFPQRYDSAGRDASYKPIQIDGSGLILYELTEYYQHTHDQQLVKKLEHKIHKAVEYIKQNIDEKYGLVYTPNSIHEFPPHEAGLEIYANAVCAGALLNLHKLGDTINIPAEYLELGQNIRSSIAKYMWNERTGSFVKVIRLKESSSVETYIDASTLALADFGVFSPSDPRMVYNVIRIENELWNKDLGGLNRYPKHVGRNNSGYGPWTHFTLMLAQYYIITGQRYKAERTLQWVLDIAYLDQQSGQYLLPEHLATKAQFEEYVYDYKRAGLLRPDRQLMIDNIRRHPTYRQQGIAYAVLPLTWAHAQFIIAWNMYKTLLS